MVNLLDVLVHVPGQTLRACAMSPSRRSSVDHSFIRPSARGCFQGHRAASKHSAGHGVVTREKGHRQGARGFWILPRLDCRQPPCGLAAAVAATLSDQGRRRSRRVPSPHAPLLAVCEEAMDRLEPLPAGRETRAAVTTLRDHLYTTLSSRNPSATPLRAASPQHRRTAAAVPSCAPVTSGPSARQAIFQ